MNSWKIKVNCQEIAAETVKKMSYSDVALNTCGLPCGSAVILRAYLSQQSVFGWPHHTHYAHNMIRLDNLFISSTYLRARLQSVRRHYYSFMDALYSTSI